MHKTSKLLLAILVIAVAVTALAACVGTTFKVTFRLYGDETDVVEVAQGNTVDKPADPTRTGYVFAGWYADGDFTEVFDFGAAIDKDTDVYAKWTPASGSGGEQGGPGGQGGPEQGGPGQEGPGQEGPGGEDPLPGVPTLSFNAEGWVEYRTTAIGLTIADGVSSEIRELLTGEGATKTANTRFGEFDYSNKAEYMSKITEKLAEKYFVMRLTSNGRVTVYYEGLYDQQSNRDGISYGIGEGNEYKFYVSGEESFRGVITDSGMKLIIDDAYTYSELLDAPLPEALDYVVEGVSQYLVLETIDNSEAYENFYGNVYTVQEPNQPLDMEFASHDYAFLAQYDDQRFTWHQYGNRVYVNLSAGDEEETTMVVDITENGMSATMVEEGGMTMPIVYKAKATVYETVEGKAFAAMDGMVKIQFLTETGAYAEFAGDGTIAEYYTTGKYIVVNVMGMEVIAVRMDAEGEIKFKADVPEFGGEMTFTVDEDAEINVDAPLAEGKEYELGFNGKYVVVDRTKFNTFITAAAANGMTEEKAVEFIVNMAMGGGSDDITTVVAIYKNGMTLVGYTTGAYTEYSEILTTAQLVDKVILGYLGVGTIDENGVILFKVPSYGIDTVEDYGFIAYMECAPIDGSSLGYIEETANETIYGTVWEVESIETNLSDDAVLPMGNESSITVADYKAAYANQMAVFYKDSYFIIAEEGMGWTPTARQFMQSGKYIAVYNYEAYRIQYTLENGKLVTKESSVFRGEDGVDVTLDMRMTLKKVTVADQSSPFFNLETTPSEFLPSDPGPGPGPGPGPDPSYPQESDYLGSRFDFAGIVSVYPNPDSVPELTEDEIIGIITSVVSDSYVEIVAEPEWQNACMFMSFNDGRRRVERIDYNVYVYFDEDGTTMLTRAGFDVSYMHDGVRYYAFVQVEYEKSDYQAEYDFSYQPDNEYTIYHPIKSEYINHRFVFGEIVEVTDICYNGEGDAPDEDVLRAAAEQAFSGNLLEFVTDPDGFYYSYFLYNDGNHMIATVDSGIPYEVTFDENDIDIVLYQNSQFYFDNQHSYCMFRVKFVLSADDPTFDIGRTPEDIAGTYVSEDGEITVTAYQGINPEMEGALTVDFNGDMRSYAIYGEYLKSGMYIVYRYVDGRLIPFAETFSEQDDEYWFGYVGSVYNQTFTKTEADPIPVIDFVAGKTFVFDLDAQNSHWNVYTNDGNTYMEDINGNIPEDAPVDLITALLDSFAGLTVSVSGTDVTVGDDTREIGFMSLNGMGFDIGYYDNPIEINGAIINGLFYEAFSEGRFNVSGYFEDENSEIRGFSLYLTEVAD